MTEYKGVDIFKRMQKFGEKVDFASTFFPVFIAFRDVRGKRCTLSPDVRENKEYRAYVLHRKWVNRLFTKEHDLLV